MNDKAEEVGELTDDGNVECDDGTVSPTPATVPKKRGRPRNSEKPKKIVSGRGRGRPSKGAVNKKPAKVADGTEDEGTASDGDSPLPNGDGAAKAPLKRGRHPQRKRKLDHTIEATGKGRGLPKKASKADAGDDEEEASDDNDDGASTGYKPVKKANTKAAKKGRGRP